MNKNTDKFIGKVFKNARLKKDMTQKDVADLVGATQQAISLIENDETNTSVQLKMCKLLGLTVEDVWVDENGKMR